jgi:general secretion pathway protein K
MNSSHWKSSRAQRGVALVTVLFLFALATVIISGVVATNYINTQRASSVLESEQAYLLCLSGEELARAMLADDFLTNPNIDHAHEKWAIPGNILEVDNGYIEVSIEDAQGKFNLNNLVTNAGVADPNYKLAFQRLLDIALHDETRSALLAGEAADWLDVDTINGVEDADYLSETIPYRPANSPVTDISELRWLKDMDLPTYRLLQQEIFPFMVALPKSNVAGAAGATRFNINTVSAPVLAAILGMVPGDAEKAVQVIQGNKDGYSDVAQAIALFPPQAQSALGQHAVTYTEYFQVRVRARFADHYAFLTSLIFRDHQKGTLSVLSRDRSERFIFPFSKDYNGNLKTKDYDIDI